MAKLKQRGLVDALAVAAALRLVVFALAVREPARFVTKDSLEYEALGHHWTTAYVDTHRGHLFDLSLLRPPGYPALIAVVHNTTAVIVVQLVLSVATVALTYLLGAALLGERAGVAASFLLAIDPVSIAMSSNLTTETLFAFLLVLAAWLWVTGRLLAGLALGIATLVRPIALYLPVLLLPLSAMLPRRRAVAAAALAVGFAVPVGLWAARNHHETGVATVSTISAHNLLDYRAADALAIEHGTSRPDEAARLEREVGPAANPAKRAQHESSLAWRTLLHHPRGAAQTTVEGLGRVVLGPGRAEMLRLVVGRTDTRTVADTLLVAVEALVLFATLLLAAAGVVLLARRRAWLALAGTLTFAAYDILLSAGAEGNARLRMPAAPFLAVLAAVAVSSLAARSAGRRASRSRSTTRPAPSTR